MEKGMKAIGNKTCKKCSTYPSFNFKGKIKGKYCALHKLDGMVDVYANLCKNCEVRANFNYKGEKKAIRRFRHKEKGMININSNIKQCEECDSLPYYNFEGETIPIRCKDHILKGMKDVSGKHIICKECDKRALYNFEGEKEGIYCKAHAKDHMVDVINFRCIEENCGKIGPKFGYPGQKPICCRKHKLRGMIPNPTKRCIHDGCREIAIYGTDITQFHCEDHKVEEEVNLLEKECKKCNLLQILGADGLCGYCNPNLYKIYEKLKENRVREFLEAKKLEYTHDKIVEMSCGKERPDFLIDCGSFFVVIEVDENQHSHIAKECEVTRMINISQALALPVWFIRYNPDKYRKIDNNRKIEGDTIKKRHQTLWNWIIHCQNNNPLDIGAYLSVVYLYYDGWTGVGEQIVMIKMD